MKNNKPSLFSSFLPALLLMACLMVMTACTGCATFGEAPARVLVEMHGANQFLVEGQSVDTANLTKAVKRTGADSTTEIRIQTPGSMPPGNVIPVVAALKKAGYHKVFLVHPREATAVVSPAPLPKPAPRR